MSNLGYATFCAGGCQYAYDTSTNAIIKLDSSVQQILDDYFRLSRNELEMAHPALSEDELNSSIEFIEKAIHTGLLQPLSAINFSPFVSRDEFQAEMETTASELTLSVAEQCNQFCSYCRLTDLRLLQPKRRFPLMTWEVARSSLDYFLAATSAERPASITFYGGEPLLNWELIQKCLHYLRESYAGRKMDVRLVSNATLLNRGILETLIDTGAHLQVSLDGPQHINDAARTYGDGRGTYQQVCDWLTEIRSLNPDYFRNNIFLHCTFDQQNDLLEIFRYFSEGMFAEVTVTLGYVTGSSPNRVPLSPEQAAQHEERVDQLIEMYLASLRSNSSFKYGLFWSILRDSLLLENRTLGLALGPIWPNGACVPGVRRLYVASDGRFYSCEKFCPQGWDIGNYQTGIEFSKAQALFETYVRLCQERCQGCWAYRLCSLCYLSMLSGGQVDTSAKTEKCNRQRERIVKALRRFVYIWENEPPETHNHPFSLHSSVRNQRITK